MARLNKEQKEKVNQFCGVTGETSTTAQEYLKSVGWALEPALNEYFSNPPAQPASEASAPANRGNPIQEAEALYQAYKGDDEAVDAAGIERLIEDLGLEPTDKVLIVFSYHCGAKSMGGYSKAEFLRGLLATGGTTVAKLRARLPALRSELDKADTFAEVYRYTYGFACEEGKRILPLEMACVLWGILFSGAQAWRFTDDWTEFLTEHHKRPVIEDTWTLLLDFRRNVADDFSDFDDTEAWPVLIDEFVEYMQEKGKAT